MVPGWAAVRGTLGVGACPDPADMVAQCEDSYPAPSGSAQPRPGAPTVRGRRPEPRGGRASFLGVPDGGSKEPEIVSSVSGCVSTMHLLMTWVR